MGLGVGYVGDSIVITSLTPEPPPTGAASSRSWTASSRSMAFRSIARRPT